ncbi:tripartite tricarboxylate transporter substrate binding protein [Roseospira marina]|nr:tripartite tricarboxylate transporter substrate binding protein [Roseospira marina]MBB5088730.1 tripartite-type tricarboxylate transporter receptor subunit TctC [Roseospira marina]
MSAGERERRWARWGARLAACVAVLTAVVSGGIGTAHAEWPERPVTLIVPSGAGGGTDQTGRLLAAALEERFGQPFTVVNQGQGGGVVGIRAIRDAPPDGYTLGILYNFAHYKALGQADFEPADFTPIAQYNFDPAAVQVRADAPWPDLPAALEALRADPETYPVACAGGCGGSWPMAIASLFATEGVDLARVRMIPSQGAAASLQDLVAGGVAVVPCSLPEARGLLQAGMVRALAVFGEERQPAFPDVPTVAETMGEARALGAWRGVVGPAGLPEKVAGRLETAMDAIVHDPAFREAMAAGGFGLAWRDATAFEAFMAAEAEAVRTLIPRLGL